MKNFALILIILFSLALGLTAQDDDHKYRPLFHYTPQENWMNDPNGMFFNDGVYHLYYQYNPFGTTWGNMHWGHATSTDLVTWEQQTIALYEEDGISMFSGSAVVDRNNTSGLGTNDQYPIIAIYTAQQPGNQSQHIAYSLDGGYKWTKYDGNPVLDVNSADFRDPKVFWHEETGRWIMVVALAIERRIKIYGSGNLIDWEELSTFGPMGSVGGVWECPDLFALPVDGDSTQMKWVLEIDMNAQTNNPGSGGQYFIGDFDGTTFTPELLEEVKEPADEIIENFEDGYENWTISGSAFGENPAQGTLPDQQTVSGFKGDHLVNSYFNGDATTGTAVSDTFNITHSNINLLVGGGVHDNTAVHLVMDGTVVRAASGKNSEELRWKAWDVEEFIGEPAQIKIIDENTGGWGHILVDHIVFANAPASSGKLYEWIDFGHDFYAAVSWYNDTPGADREWLAWSNNWAYANHIPTGDWRGAMTLPRKVELRTVGDDIKVFQNPVESYKKLRDRSFTTQNVTIEEEWDFPETDLLRKGAFEIDVSLRSNGADNYGFRIKDFSGGELSLTVNNIKKELTVKRVESDQDFESYMFSNPQTIDFADTSGIDIKLIYDKSISELFIDGGEFTFTNRIFIRNEHLTARFFANGGNVEIVELKARSLNPDVLTSAESIGPTKPLEFNLHQNYPNPFNPSTNIEFTLTKRSEVTLSIYDMLGRKVSTLTAGEKLAAGKHHFTWNAKKTSASGIYLIRLQAGDGVQTRKMTLIK